MTTVIIKPTRHCNLRCTYCHDWREFGSSRPLDLGVLVELTRKLLADNKHVRFIWHGGEPLLLGDQFFKKALWIQNELATEEHEVRNTLQSNGLLIDDHWCEFFARHRIEVGVSIDGPREMHNRTRRRVGDRDSYDAVLRGLDCLRRNRIPFGVLIVLNRRIWEMGARAIFDWTKEIGVRNYSLLPVRPDNLHQDEGRMAAHDYVLDHEYSAFMCDLYDCWREEDDRSIHIREIQSIQQVLYEQSSTVCVLSGGCAGRYFGVEADGRIHHCDKYVEDEDYYLGNVMEQSFEELRQHPNMRRILRDNQAAEGRCQKHCKWYHVCHGGCPHDRYLRDNYSVRSEPETCCGQARLIEHIHRAELPLADVAQAVLQP